MAILKRHDISGKESGAEECRDDVFISGANLQMIKDYLVAQRANKRQWSASTQGRSEVNHSKKKPHAQKGTGNARQGFLGAPQYRGGGRVHAPRPKFDQHVRINRKEKRIAIAHLLKEKIEQGSVIVLDAPHLEVPKTKVVASFLKAMSFEGKRVLFLAEENGSKKHAAFVQSVRNLPKVEFSSVADVNGYALALSQVIVVLSDGVEELKVALGARGAAV